MKLLPLPLSMTASSCDESTSTGMANSDGCTTRSAFLASTVSSSPLSCTLPSINERTTSFSFRCSALLCISFHITNLLNENSPNSDSSITSQRDISLIDCRTAESIIFTSTPCSSLGSGLKMLRFTLNCCLRSSTKVMFIMMSSSRVLII